MHLRRRARADPAAVRAQVKNFEAFRRALPAEARLYVAKNTLLRLAADRVEGWSELKQARARCARPVCCVCWPNAEGQREVSGSVRRAAGARGLACPPHKGQDLPNTACNGVEEGQHLAGSSRCLTRSTVGSVGA